jgi:hypothetical protein
MQLFTRKKIEAAVQRSNEAQFFSDAQPHAPKVARLLVSYESMVQCLQLVQHFNKYTMHRFEQFEVIDSGNHFAIFELNGSYALDL